MTLVTPPPPTPSVALDLSCLFTARPAHPTAKYLFAVTEAQAPAASHGPLVTVVMTPELALDLTSLVTRHCTAADPPALYALSQHLLRLARPLRPLAVSMRSSPELL